ncbi:hypothetical protein ACQKMI_02720 [Lysinibacillus sp. NPDC097214]|uniref:hypothetical protein n=1 Tax=Lysinibacillus sp. NPDC097214 TaxID=3390584 RepID=UPI003D052762
MKNEREQMTEDYYLNIALNAKDYGMKNIYKKSLAIELIELGHDLSHTMRNKLNPRYQVFTFFETPEFVEDLLKLTAKKSED